MGSLCSFLSSAPGSLWGRAGLAALGPGVAAAPEAGGVDDKFVFLGGECPRVQGRSR